jgi:MFS family permease
MLRRAFWGVMAAFLVHGLVVSTWVSRIAGVKRALHLGDGSLGLALLGAAIGSVASIPLAGALVTRFGSRRVTFWSGIGFCAALLPLAMARNLTELTAGLVLYGMASGMNDVSMNAQAVGTERLLGTPSISRFHAMFSFAGIIGAALGSLAAGGGLSIPMHLAVAAVACVLVNAVAARLMMETRSESAPAHLPGLRRLPRAILVLSAIGFCIFLSEGAIADWTAVYLKQVLRAGDAVAPLAYAAFSAAMTIFRAAGDAITLRLGRVRTIGLGAATAAAGLVLVVLAPAPWMAIAGFALAGVGFSSIIPLVFAAGGRIPGIGEGAGVAVASGIGYLGFLAGPTAIGFLSEGFSLRAGMGLLVVLSTLAALLIVSVRREVS